MITTAAPSSTDLYYWLLRPKGSGGGGRSVYGAALWLDEWDGVSLPDGFGGTMAP